MPNPFQNGNIIGAGTNADIDNAEEDILVITDVNKLRSTQVTVYVEALNLGTNTSLELRFWCLDQVSGTWYPRVKQNEADNTLDDEPAIIDANTPNGGLVFYELEMPACSGFKVTGKGVGGANTAVTLKAMGRYN